MRREYTPQELTSPERTEVLGAKVCPLFLLLAHRAAEREGTTLSRLVRGLLRDKLTREERARLDEVRAAL